MDARQLPCRELERSEVLVQVREWCGVSPGQTGEGTWKCGKTPARQVERATVQPSGGQGSVG
eukprot:4861852-Heterocapsa_arctica.AAC.1